MIVAPQLSCLGCYCAVIGAEDGAEITWEIDWTGKEGVSSHCVPSLLSVPSQVATDAPLNWDTQSCYQFAWGFNGNGMTEILPM